MKRLKKLATILPNSAKLSSKHFSKIKGGTSGDDKRGSTDPDPNSNSGG